MIVRIFRRLLIAALALTMMIGVNGMAVELVSVDQFLEKAGIPADSPEEREAIAQFIAERDLDAFIFELLPDEVVRAYADCLLYGEKISYSDYLEAEAGELAEDADFSDLKTLVLEIEGDATLESAVVSFEHGKAYLSLSGSVIDDVCYAEKTVPLTEELETALRAALAGAELPREQYEFKGDDEVRGGFILVLETDEGLVRYVAYGGGNGFPDTAAEACYAIIRLLNEA